MFRQRSSTIRIDNVHLSCLAVHCLFAFRGLASRPSRLRFLHTGTLWVYVVLGVVVVSTRCRQHPFE